jgi:hypothetical protein
MSRSDVRISIGTGEVPEGGTNVIRNQQKVDSNISLQGIAEAVPQFEKEQGYTTFTAEHALVDGNIVIHFFLPEDYRGNAQQYWTVRFPLALDGVAQAHFQATAPRLQAKYTEELRSWWFKATNYDHVVDLPRFIRKFFDALDEALEVRA